MRNQAHIEAIADRQTWRHQWDCVRSDIVMAIEDMRETRMERLLQGPPIPVGTEIYPHREPMSSSKFTKHLRAQYSAMRGLDALRDRCYAKLRGLPQPGARA